MRGGFKTAIYGPSSGEARAVDSYIDYEVTMTDKQFVIALFGKTQEAVEKTARIAIEGDKKYRKLSEEDRARMIDGWIRSVEVS